MRAAYSFDDLASVPRRLLRGHERAADKQDFYDLAERLPPARRGSQNVRPHGMLLQITRRTLARGVPSMPSIEGIRRARGGATELGLTQPS